MLIRILTYAIGLALIDTVIFLVVRAKRKVSNKINEKKETKRIEKVKQIQIERNLKEHEELEHKRQEQARIEQERKGPDWICPQCSFSNPGKNRFCPKCGYKNI